MKGFKYIVILTFLLYGLNQRVYANQQQLELISGTYQGDHCNVEIIIDDDKVQIEILGKARFETTKIEEFSDAISGKTNQVIFVNNGFFGSDKLILKLSTDNHATSISIEELNHLAITLKKQTCSQLVKNEDN